MIEAVGETSFERLSQDRASSAVETKHGTRTIMQSVSPFVMIGIIFGRELKQSCWSVLADDFRTFFLSAESFELVISTV